MIVNSPSAARTTAPPANSRRGVEAPGRIAARSRRLIFPFVLSIVTWPTDFLRALFGMEPRS
jgi:hypothetical protein